MPIRIVIEDIDKITKQMQNTKSILELEVLSKKTLKWLYEYSTTTAYSYDDWKTVFNMLAGKFGKIPDIETLDKINKGAIRLTTSPIKIAMFLIS